MGSRVRHWPRTSAIRIWVATVRASAPRSTSASSPRRKLSITGSRSRWGHYFIAPRAGITRQPYYIYGSSTQGDNGPTSDYRISERQSQFAGAAADVGATDGKYQEVRAGLDFEHVTWTATTGSDGLPNYNSNSSLARVRYVFDNQDRALVPRFGGACCVECRISLRHSWQPKRTENDRAVRGRAHYQSEEHAACEFRGRHHVQSPRCAAVPVHAGADRCVWAQAPSTNTAERTTSSSRRAICVASSRYRRL